MKHANEPLHAASQLRGAKGPAFGKQQVVAVLKADTGVFAKYIEFVELLLQVYKADLPGPLLLFDGLFERIGGAAVSSSGIEEEEVDFLKRHMPPSAPTLARDRTSYGFRDRGGVGEECRVADPELQCFVELRTGLRILAARVERPGTGVERSDILPAGDLGSGYAQGLRRLVRIIGVVKNQLAIGVVRLGRNPDGLALELPECSL